MDSTASDTLDNPIWHSLVGTHSGFSHLLDDTAAYQTEVSLFAGAATAHDEPDWAALMEVAGRDRLLVQRVAAGPQSGNGWRRTGSMAVQQMVLDQAFHAGTRTAVRAVPLGPRDVPDILDLVGLTRPGPFGVRTIELGGYIGVRSDDGTLVAMAGTRMAPPGWGEISGVCTRAEARGQGLAQSLMAAVAAGILDTGRRPFLHVASANARALSLYQALGFTVRRAFVIETIQRD